MPKKYSKKQIISFQEKIFKIVKKIPKGKVLTYKEVAVLAGFPCAWRAVGTALNKNRLKIPCHRVIRSDGLVGDYRYGMRKKISLLKKEDMVIKNKRIVR